MTNPKINIASLSFDEIKASLKTYVTQSGSPFNTYSGTAFDSLLDVFAYNTLFYSYYLNMVANETFLSTASIENNIVSLVKPLGILVNGKTSSVKQLTAIGSSVSAYVTPFRGSNSFGSYAFYAVDDIDVTGTPQSFNVYESKAPVKDLQVVVDIANQKAFLGNTNIDINTVSIKVNGVKWTKHSSFETNPGADSNVYFLDRTSSGFYLVFGKRTLNDYQTSFGKDIASGDVVTVSYLLPSGKNANSVGIVSNDLFTVSTQTSSAGGKDGADLDLIRTFAPKLFAANDRAVTKDDYYGLLLASTFIPTTITTSGQINVWGGEDADPPAYGRVFISFAEESLLKTTPSVVSSIAYLKTKNVITVVPEYTRMQPIQIGFNIGVSNSTDSSSAIKTAIESYYNTIKTFNNTIKYSDIVTIVTSLPGSGSASVIMTNTTMSLDVLGSTVAKNVYFKNELFSLTRLTSDGSAITSSSFSYNGATITLKDHPTTFSNDLGISGNILGYDTTTGTSIGILGFIDYVSGYITIKANVLPTNTPTTITAIPKIPTEIVMKNELVPTIIVTI